MGERYDNFFRLRVYVAVTNRVDLLSLGFSGFSNDAAKHIEPDDLAAIFTKLKSAMGAKLPEDWFTKLGVATGGEADLLVRD
jgi:alpha-amylase